MSVISLSSENEDVYVILDSDDEDSGDRSSQTHQVFIVENKQSCSNNEEVVLQNVTNNLEEPNNSYNCDNKIINFNSSCIVNSYQTLPITNISAGNKSESSLKLLAERLAKVLGNDKATPETNMFSHGKTISDKPNRLFLQNNRENDMLGSRTVKKAKDSLLIKSNVKKVKKSRKKMNSDVEVSQAKKMQSSGIHSVQIVSEAKSEVNQISSQATKGVKRNTNIQRNQQKRSLEPVKNSIQRHKKKLTKHTKSTSPKKSGPYDNKLNVEMQSSVIQSVQIVSEAMPEANQISSQAIKSVKRNTTIQRNQQKRSLEPVENAVQKHKKKMTKHTKPPSPKKSGPYDNRLKFTFDKRVSTYSVSVVSPSKPEQSAENINIFQNNPHENHNGNSVKDNSFSCKKTMKLTADLNLDKYDPIDQPDVITSGDFRSCPSPIPFSNILNIQSSFIKHYNIVFDDNTDVLCIEMGNLLLKIIEEEQNLKKILSKTQPSHNLLLGSDKFQTEAQTCRDAFHHSKRKFIDNFSQIHNRLNSGHVIGTQLKTVLLTAWFLKMFLSITTTFPDFMDGLNALRIEALKLLSEETVKWPLISKTFLKDEYQFFCDCLLVLELIKDCLKDQNELNFQSNVGLDQIINADKPQTVTCVTSNNQAIALPKDLEVSVIMTNSTEAKTSNDSGICKTDSNLTNIYKTNLENPTIGYGSKKTGQNLTNPVQSVRPDLHYQYEASPFLKAQSEKQFSSNYALYSNTPLQPNLQNQDTSCSLLKNSQNQYHSNNQENYRESSTNLFKTTGPITLNHFHESFYPMNLVDSDSNMQQLPVLDGGSIEISSCPITINNYNNYSLLLPELISNYHNSSFHKKGEQL